MVNCPVSAARRAIPRVNQSPCLPPRAYRGSARRGFCAECGSSLFWDSPNRGTISIAAGTLDSPTGLRVAGHWYVWQAGDYYDAPDDGLQQPR